MPVPPTLDKGPANGLQGSSYLYNMGTSPNTRTAVSSKVRLLAPAYGDSTALHQMGVISTLNLNETKGIEPVRGIGFGDKIAELVPSVTEPMTGSFERALLYLCNLWQATGYAAGVDGPVRSLKDHRWPFDVEQQLVFSSLADVDMNVANTGWRGTPGQFDGGVRQISFPQNTPDGAGAPDGGITFPGRGHSAVITILEACWFNSWGVSYSKDAGQIMETGDITITDVHDFASVYGEFLPTGNDPTIGQLGSIRYSENGFAISPVGASITGGGAQSAFSQLVDATV